MKTILHLVIKKRVVLVATLIILFFSITSKAQVSGTVFRDINSDGVRQSVNPTEPGEFGVTVNAYNATNTLIGTAVTNGSGVYSFSAATLASGQSVRLEFIGSAADGPSKRISSNRSNVQFVVAGASAVNIDYAIASKKLLSNNSNPYVATSGYVNGDANATGAGNAGDYNSLYVFPYDLSNDGGTTRRAKNQYTGSVFGLAWQRESRTLFMSAYLKRHTGFGPGGIGAIYKSQISTSGVPANPTLLVDVNTIGINVGTSPRTVTLPANASTPNTDIGVFAEIGKRGIGGMEISADGRELYIVNMFQNKIHRINIGNPLKSSITAADVTGNWAIPDPGIAGTQWHPMAIKIKDSKIYIGGICTKETTSFHNIADTANLRGIVYEFNPATGVFSEVLRFPLSHRKGYANNDYRYEFRNNYWSAWQNNGDISLTSPLRTGLIGGTTGSNATGIYYPQPLFSAIEFDIDGSMIIGIRDRFGDQGGYANYFETGNVSGETYRTLSSGEVLRAGKNGSVWMFENAASVTSNGVTTTTPGVADNNSGFSGSFTGTTGTPWGGNYGPGGKYYYYNFNYSKTGVPSPFNSAATNTAHYLKSNGGLAYLPGYNEVLTTAIDPMGNAYTNGLLKNVNLGTEAGNMAARMDLIANPSNDPALMGKSAALGDVELLLDAASMEIGNRVWFDQNRNGIQDANELGMSNVSVVLTSPGVDGIYSTLDDQVWTVVTDAQGHYYFDKTIVNDNRRPSSWIGVSSTNSGILPGFEYRIEINLNQPVLNGLYSLTYRNVSSNRTIDSDASYKALATNIAQHVFNAGGPTAANSVFENDYNVDFGLMDIPLPLELLTFTGEKKTECNNLNWSTTEEINTDRFEIENSTDGNFFSRIGIVVSKNNNSSITNNYSFLHKNPTGGMNYYRLKMIDIDGKFKYSPVISIKNDALNIAMYPNPVSNEIRVSIPGSWQNKKVVYEIFNSNGQLTKRNEVTNSTKTEVIDVSSLLPGFYIVRVSFDEQTAQQKIVKQ